MPDQDLLVPLVMLGVMVALIVVGVPLFYARLYRKVDAGQALIVNKLARMEVSFTGALVVPSVHRSEVMDISIKTIEIDRRGKDGVHCKDDIRVDLKATFFVRINKTTEDVIRVATAVGAGRASDPQTLQELFAGKFLEGIETVAKMLDFEELYTKRSEFRDRILATIGEDLSGYVLDDLAIDYLEQTPIDALDRNNILDARGIRKITELTTAQAIAVQELHKEQKKHEVAMQLEAKELLIELERRQHDALAKLKADTGRELTIEQLEDRLADRLREMVAQALEQRG